MKNMSGLELMQAMVAGQIPMAPIAHVIPMKGVAAEHGRVVFEAQALSVSYTHLSSAACSAM